MYLFALIAFGLALFNVVGTWRQPSLARIIATTLWLLYAIFELLVNNGTLCDEKCNIRVDLLVIWPILAVASFFAYKPPGQWSLLTKLFGAASIGSLLLSLVMVALVYLESLDAFFPARRECRSGGAGAVRACDEAIRVAPRAFTLYYHRALAYRASGQLDRGIADMSKAIAGSSSPYSVYSDAHTGRGILFFEKGEIERAMTEFDAAIKINPDDTVAYFRRGIAHASKGNLHLALDDVSKAIELESRVAPTSENRLVPAKGVIIENRGWMHLRLGSLDKAISDYDAALKLESRRAGSLYGRGLAKLGRGDKVGGDADIARAKAIDAGIDETFAKWGMN